MPVIRRRSAPALLLVAAVLLPALGGCGRRGPLEPPPGSVEYRPPATSRAGQATTTQASRVVDQTQPQNPFGAPDTENEPLAPPRSMAPKRPFFLDPLL